MNKKIIGANIKKLRNQFDLTQSQLAELSNLSLTHISKLEIGESNLSLESLITLCEVLKASPNDILQGVYSIYETEDSLKDELLYDKNQTLSLEHQLLLNDIKTTIKQESKNNLTQLKKWMHNKNMP